MYGTRAMQKIKQEWVRLQAAIEASELSQLQIAAASGVNQATVSRVLARCPKRRGAAFAKLCKYASNLRRKGTRIDPRKSDFLMQALSEVWDGTPQHAEALAEIIQAVGNAARVFRT